MKFDKALKFLLAGGVIATEAMGKNLESLRFEPEQDYTETGGIKIPAKIILQRKNKSTGEQIQHGDWQPTQLYILDETWEEVIADGVLPEAEEPKTPNFEPKKNQDDLRAENVADPHTDPMSVDHEVSESDSEPIQNLENEKDRTDPARQPEVEEADKQKKEHTPLATGEHGDSKQEEAAKNKKTKGGNEEKD